MPEIYGRREVDGYGFLEMEVRESKFEHRKLGTLGISDSLGVIWFQPGVMGRWMPRCSRPNVRVGVIELYFASV